MAFFGDQEHVEIQCGTCAIWFAFPKIRYDHCRREGGFWTCPNGHSRGWAKGEEQEEMAKLRRDRDRIAQQVAQRDDEIAAKEREIKRIKKRASAGTCPCCTRTFSNMSVHMRKKHPEFVAENVIRLKTTAKK